MCIFYLSSAFIRLVILIEIIQLLGEIILYLDLIL